MANSDEFGPKLSEIFDDVWKTWEYLDTTDEPSSSQIVQMYTAMDSCTHHIGNAVEYHRGLGLDIPGKSRLHEGSQAAEKAIRMVNTLRLFSENEEIDEVSTNEIRYMLLPALLGYFHSNNSTSDRLKEVQQAQVFYVDFLQMCHNYGVTNIEVPKIKTNHNQEEEGDRISPVHRAGPPDLAAMNATRQAKIQRFKEMKDTENRLVELRPLIEREHVDDEVKREYYTKLLKKWVNKTLEEIESLEGELGILQHMARMKLSGEPSEPVKTKSTNPAFRPFILTKSVLQKNVIGAGYPSLPTYTIEEFFDQQVEAGNFPQPGSMPALPTDPDRAEREAAEKQATEDDAAAEADDPEALQKARDWDDWKDDHRRGWGNTQNKG